MANLPDARSTALELLRAPEHVGQTLWMEVRGHSMLPTLKSTDRVEVEVAAPGNLRLGDLALIRTNETEWVIHRFFGFHGSDPSVLLTKGDSRPCFDPGWPGSWLIGRVRAVERDGRRRCCGRIWLLVGTARSVLVWLRARAARLFSTGSRR